MAHKQQMATEQGYKPLAPKKLDPLAESAKYTGPIGFDKRLGKRQVSNGQ